VACEADTIIFPELSLTGYEPTLAKAVAVSRDDACLAVFQDTVDARQVTIGVGMPTPSDGQPYISMIIFQPHQPRQLYSKQYLHADELPFFAHGHNATAVLGDKSDVALAICYELSVPEHAQQAFANGANIYVASVAKSASGVEQASQRLAKIARSYDMTVLMVNCVGPSDDFVSAGGTAVWNNQGNLLAQLDDAHEGILIYDTDSQEVTQKII
jgi:predicted amidohydrolase